jgi:hypothetical protein
MRKDGTAENSKLTLTALDHEQVFKGEFDVFTPLSRSI